MRRIFTLITLILTICIQSQAQTSGKHLKPVSGIFGIHNFKYDYYTRVKKVLFKDLSDGPVLRFLVIPTFTPEHVTDIEYDTKSTKHFLVHQQCEALLWHNEKWQEVKVKRYKKEIDKKDVELLKSLFKKAVSLTRFPEKETIVLDGTDYFFSINDYGLKSGMVWSPPKSTPMKELVDIANQLVSATTVEKKIISLDEKLTKQINSLIKKLN